MERPLTNIIGEAFCRTSGPAVSYLDKACILYKVMNGEWIGKRSVYTYELKACWLEETAPEHVKSWWCGKEADYSEIFKQEWT